MIVVYVNDKHNAIKYLIQDFTHKFLRKSHGKEALILLFRFTIQVYFLSLNNSTAHKFFFPREINSIANSLSYSKRLIVHFQPAVFFTITSWMSPLKKILFICIKYNSSTFLLSLKCPLLCTVCWQLSIYC